MLNRPSQICPKSGRGIRGSYLRASFKFCSLLCAFLLAGCGLIYSNRVAPYSSEFGETPVGAKRCIINKHQVKEPVTGYNLYTDWTSSYILDEARKAGITNVYYMDKQTLSILLGLYKRESIIVYGD